MSDNQNREIHHEIKRKGDFDFILGSSADCEIAMEVFRDKISPRHAALKRNGDRLFLRDLGSAQGTFINGKKIGTRWREITLHDRVFFGKIPVTIEPKLLLGRDRVSIIAENICYTIPERGDIQQASGLLRKTFKIIKHLTTPPKPRVLTNNVSISADPETLIGIMGPSGAGKTVLLNLMSGHLKPQKGRVMVGNFNVHESFGLIKDIIGYVPQDDTLIPELTVRQSLHFCLRLRYPDMRPDVRDTLIKEVLEKMGFTGDRLPKLLNTKIGSPDQRGLSGGERRRVNIAHELVRSPLLLFLDEPTSGLSSVDSEYVVGLLKHICKEKKATMLMTIHQPSEAIFDQLDSLLLLNRGGNVVYFGPPGEAEGYFSKYSEESTEGNPAEYVLRVLENWEYKEKTLEELYEEQNKDRHEKEGSASQEKEKKEILKQVRKKSHRMIYQLFLLLERNIQVKISDKMSLALLLFQAIIISSLLVVTFRGFPSDYKNFDKFAKTWFSFTAEYDEAGKAGKILVVEPAFRKSGKDADKNTHIFGEHTAQRRASILFLLIASAIWFGVVNASREIVSEKFILKRETRSSLCISSYLTAKVCTLFIIAFIQTLILLAITCSFLLSVSLTKFLQFWSVLVVTSMAASSLGIFISSVVKNEQASLMAVPILIIPQLFLGGLVRPIKFFHDDIFLRLSDLVLQKWFFKALLMFDSANEKNILIQTCNLNDRDPFNYVRFAESVIADVFFKPSSGDFFHVFGAIALHALIPLLLAYIWLKRKYS